MGNVLQWSFQEPNRKKKVNSLGIEIVFLSPNNALIPYSFALTKGCSNKTEEYDAIIAGLRLALQIPITNLTIYNDGF